MFSDYEMEEGDYKQYLGIMRRRKEFIIHY